MIIVIVFTVKPRFFLQVTMTGYSLFIPCNNLLDSLPVKKKWV